MPFEPIFQDVNVTQKKNNVKDHVKVECKTDVASDGVSKILNVTARSCVTRSQVVDKEIYYEGRVTFFICYQTLDGDVEKCECGSEFKGSIKNADLFDCKAVVFSSVEKTETDVSGVKLGVTGYLFLDAYLTECKKISALTGGKELITSAKEIEVLKGYGMRESVYPIADEFEVPFKIQDVLSQRADAVITAVQCGVGSIIVDGEVKVSAILLQSKEKKDIIRENKIIPFRAEIECEDAMPSMCATAFVKEKSFKTDIAVDEERDISLITVSLSLALSGEAYSSENLSVVVDAFSLSENLELEKEDCSFVKPCDVRSQGKDVTVVAGIDSLPVGTSLISCIGESAEIINVSCDKGQLNVTGALNATVFFKDADGKVFSRKVEAPFDAQLDCACESDCEYTVRACASNSNVKLISDSEVEIRANIFFTVYPLEKCYMQIVKGVKSLGEKQQPTHAISVYIPREGEELWSLSKRLNVCPEDLINTNQDLQFPLSGKERIVVYRKK